MVFNRIKQYRLYKKAIKDGYVKHSEYNGQSVWFIKHDAPEELKMLGDELPKIELEYLYISYGLKTISVCLLMAILFRSFGIEI